ncbi:UNVERIFIED_CONTAM: hypothetical protein Slati_1741800 [Sesamum latifolium]|uniref:DDE Tnp4 domain-containing protein n=1 Tax=Sesamum latifolium TaxID=2727402 RepID=A0AAW2WWW3_9LAMI
MTRQPTLRMNRNAFGRLCYVLEQFGGVRDNKNVTIFFSPDLSQLLKIALTLGGDVLRVVWVHLMEHTLMLGYLIGKGRYRTRKGHVAVNILGVCNMNMQFIYVFTGWEGSVADSRVLRDAITRPDGLRVPTGKYYLCDNGYTNGDGFLAPYRGVRYHLREWDHGPMGPQNKEELFNLKHSSARNVIERTFGLLKVDPTAKSMRFKFFPYFLVWREIFRKDQATGERAKDGKATADAVREEEAMETRDYYVPTADWNPEEGFVSNDGDQTRAEMNIDPTTHSSSALNPNSDKTKKCKKPQAAPEDRLVDMVSSFCQDANARLGTLTKILQTECRDLEKCAEVENAIAEIEGIDENE